MIRKLRESLSYANVMATIAVAIALGGTSYAALTLPRDSVGSKQLRKGAVRSREVKNASLQVADLSSAARRALRGATGAQGAQGMQGPAGEPAAKYFAAVQASGQFAAGNATSGGRAGAIGTYDVGFDRSVNGCAYTATLGTADSSTVTAGRVTVNNLNGHVGVQTFSADGTPTDLPFQLIVAC